MIKKKPYEARVGHARCPSHHRAHGTGKNARWKRDRIQTFVLDGYEMQQQETWECMKKSFAQLLYVNLAWIH